MPCERIRSRDWDAGLLKTCSMRDLTIIDDPEYEILTPRDEAMQAFTFEQNRKIAFLPVEIYEKFPNLIAYAAWSCSIKDLQKENFHNLKEIKLINLSDNLLETIHSNTFEGLMNLEEIYLGTY